MCKILSKVFNWCFEENSVKIATVSFTDPQSHGEWTTETNQTANEENINMGLKILCLKNVEGTVMQII